MYLTIILNKDNPQGLSGTLEALMQLSLLMAPHLEGTPHINIVLGGDEQVATFDILAEKSLTDDVRFLRVCEETTEKSLASGYISLAVDEKILAHLRLCEWMDEYSPYQSSTEASISRRCYRPIERERWHDILLLRSDWVVGRALNTCVMAGLDIGSRFNFQVTKISVMRAKNINYDTLVCMAGREANMLVDIVPRQERHPANFIRGDTERLDAVFKVGKEGLAVAVTPTSKFPICVPVNYDLLVTALGVDRVTTLVCEPETSASLSTFGLFSAGVTDDGFDLINDTAVVTAMSHAHAAA